MEGEKLTFLDFVAETCFAVEGFGLEYLVVHV